MPTSPCVSEQIKSRIARDAAEFIKKQISKQPTLIKIVLKIFVILLGVSIKISGNKACKLWRSVPFGRMLERLLRSLVVLIFFENSSVLNELGEETGAERMKRYRTMRNG